MIERPARKAMTFVRICMISYSFYESDNRVRRYAETLAKRGDEVDVLALGREGKPDFEVIAGVRVYRIQRRARDERGPATYLLKLLKFFVRSAWTVTVRHLHTPYSVIHVHSVPDFQVFATLVPRLMGAKVILDIHDIVPEFYASKFKVSQDSIVFRQLLLMEKLSAWFANHVIISNKLWYEKLILRAVREEKCTTIINYPDPAIFYPRPRRRIDNHDFVICYPGTLNRHQGVDIAVNAVQILRDTVPNLKMWIIGDGPDRDQLQELVRSLHLEERVVTTAPVPIDEVARIMAEVDLGVVPKRSDSFGNEAFSTKIMEFMAMGVPVVASNTRIDRYYFGDGVVQFFDSGNPEDLAAKILTLVQDHDARKALRDRGDVFIRKNNWGVKKQEYLTLVDRLLEREEPQLTAAAR